jgi:glycopeptide antibiotics resistance protein
MLEFFPIPLLAGMGTLALSLILLRRKCSQAYLICFSGFWLYLLLVVSLTLFPLPLPEEMISRRSAIDILSHVNLVPFQFGRLFENNLNVIIQEIFGNIVLTLPFGFGIPFLVRFKPKKFPLLAVGAGLAIETAQLGFSLLVNATYRSTDINDVLLNAAGATLGYALFRGFARLYVVVSNTIKINQSGLFAYIYEVAVQDKGITGANILEPIISVKNSGK